MLSSAWFAGWRCGRDLNHVGYRCTEVKQIRRQTSAFHHRSNWVLQLSTLAKKKKKIVTAEILMTHRYTVRSCDTNFGWTSTRRKLAICGCCRSRQCQIGSQCCMLSLDRTLYLMKILAVTIFFIFLARVVHYVQLQSNLIMDPRHITPFQERVI